MATMIVEHKDNANTPTSGIQEAIDALPDEGGVVRVPAGRYTLRQSIRLKTNVTLQGEGAGTIMEGPPPVVSELAESTEPNSGRIRLKDASRFRVGDQIWLRDFRQSGWNSRYLVITGINGNEVQGEIIYGDLERAYQVEERAWAGTFFPAIWAYHTKGVSIRSLTIDGGDYEFDAPDRVGDFLCSAIHTRAADDIRVEDVNIRRWPSDGISVQRGSGIVTGCVVEDCLGSGLHPGTGIGQSIWRENISRRNRKGFYFCSNVRNCVVANNIIIQNREQGIWGLGDPDRYNIVTGNVIAENGQYGIEARKGTGNIITSNLVRENSRECPGAFPGIHLEDHARNVVSGNLSLDDQEKATQSDPLCATGNEQGRNLVENNLALSASTYWTLWEKLLKKDEEHEAWKRQHGFEADSDAAEAE